MIATLRTRRNRRHKPRRTFRLRLEALETRFLPAPLTGSTTTLPTAEVEPNDTMALAQNLGSLTVTSPAEVVGAIGNGSTGASDVDWYQFTLTAPTDVHLAAFDPSTGSSFVSVLSLYNSDPSDPLGHRLLTQDDGATNGGNAQIERLLGAGTYFVAVSGSGNLYFNPFLAGSGYPGSTGAYDLRLTATDPGIAATDGPTVLTADPAPGSTLPRSPFMIRLDLSSAVDPTTVIPDLTVTLTYNKNGTFGDANDQDIPVNANFDAAVNEIQLTPQAPLAPGFYKVFLAGDSSNPNNFLVVAGPNGTALGQNSQHPNGADYTATFQVNGIAGVVGATTPDDTVATAQQLGDITQAGLRHVTGAIGDDPTDPVPFNNNGVDLYHFQINGTGNFAFGAEVFANRIGSLLNPAVSLFQLTNGQLRLVDANDNTLNPTLTPDGSNAYLYTDAALFDGLKAGDYFLAVSSSPNVPNPNKPWQPGPNAGGIFDPLTSHSATITNTSVPGTYVLNLLVQSDNQAPTVVAVTPGNGTTLSAPPTQLVVQFTKAVDLQALAYQAFQQTSQSTISSVFIEGPDGTRYFPRLVNFDDTTNQATFLMLDGLANGTYELHLSGPLGLTDFAGNPLVGNDPSGDYVTSFTVNGPVRGINGNPLFWSDQEPNDDPAQPQNLGVLFPHELQNVATSPTGTPQNGVTITRDFTQAGASAPADTADYYQFQVLQDQTYVFTLAGSLPPGVQLTLMDAAGNPIQLAGQASGTAEQAVLAAGTYILGVGSWRSAQAPGVTYQLNISLGGAADNPAPLTNGPAPALRIRLATNSPPASPPAGASSPNPAASNAAPPAFTPSDPPAPPLVVLTPPPPADPALPVPSSSSTVSSPALPVFEVNPPSQAPVVSLPSSGTIPSNLLLALGSGPAGGVQIPGANASGSVVVSFVPDRVVVRATNPLLVGSFARMTVLTPGAQFSGNSTVPPDEPAGDLSALNWPAAHDVLQPVIQSWHRALDAFFGMRGWAQTLSISAAGLDLLFEETDDGAGDFPTEPQAAVVPTKVLGVPGLDDQAWDASEPWWATTVAAALGALTLAGFQAKPRSLRSVRLKGGSEPKRWRLLRFLVGILRRLRTKRA